MCAPPASGMDPRLCCLHAMAVGGSDLKADPRARTYRRTGVHKGKEFAATRGAERLVRNWGFVSESRP